MFQAFYTGLSGMFSFSKNLDTVSNNISNMNTPGYRGADSFYQSLTSGDNLANGGSGFGTQISGLGYRFASGDIKQTGNSSDLAIAGQGMFVLMSGEQLLYTRAGQFAFNEQGDLVDKTSGLQVASIDQNGNLSPLNISNYKVASPKQTTEINFSGNLSSEDNLHKIDALKVYNKLGEEVEVSIKFTPSVPAVTGSWKVEIFDKQNTLLNTSEVRFGTDGTPAINFNSFNFQVKDSQGGDTQISVVLGQPADFTQATSLAAGADSTLTAQIKDGSAISTLSSVGFDANGKVLLKYASGEEVKGPALALANFSNQQVLKLEDGSIFSATDNSGRTITTANNDGTGKIVSESIEMSNVDLSKEFADMIIIQRGYQASSRVLDTANKMLEQLYESTRGR